MGERPRCLKTALERMIDGGLLMRGVAAAAADLCRETDDVASAAAPNEVTTKRKF